MKNSPVVAPLPSVVVEICDEKDCRLKMRLDDVVFLREWHSPHDEWYGVRVDTTNGSVTSLYFKTKERQRYTYNLLSGKIV